MLPLMGTLALLKVEELLSSLLGTDQPEFSPISDISSFIEAAKIFLAEGKKEGLYAKKIRFQRFMRNLKSRHYQNR
jgi:hypothetical protein